MDLNVLNYKLNEEPARQEYDWFTSNDNNNYEDTLSKRPVERKLY